MKKIWLILFLTLYFISVPVVYCNSSNYVLPYPSVMPGSKTYKLHLLWEKLMKYWYFGNFAQFRYNLNQSDKYLVEAKTLFEYKQYLLAYSALQKSDLYFKEAPLYLKKALKENKNVVQKQNVFKSAEKKHLEVLNDLISQVPLKFEWKDEKSSSITLDLHKAIINSIEIREQSL